MFVSQFQNADQLLFVKKSVLYRWMVQGKLGNPEVTTDHGPRVSILDMTGRCGSTLVCAMMRQIPNVKIFSEPFVFLHAHFQYISDHIDKDEYLQMLQTCIKCLLKNVDIKETSHVFIKFQPACNSIIEYMRQLYPHFNYLFITRQFDSSLMSWSKMMHTLPTFFRYKRDLMIRFVLQTIPFPYGDQDWIRIRQGYLE